MTTEKRQANRVTFGSYIPFSIRLTTTPSITMESRRHELSRGRVLGELSKYEASYSRVLEEAVAWWAESLEAGKVPAAWQKGALDLYLEEVEAAPLFVLSARISVVAADLLENLKRDLVVEAIKTGKPRSQASFGRIFSLALMWWEHCTAQGKLPKTWSAHWLERMRPVWAVGKAEKASTPALADVVRQKIAAGDAPEPPRRGRPRKVDASPKGKGVAAKKKK